MWHNVKRWQEHNVRSAADKKYPSEKGASFLRLYFFAAEPDREIC